MTETTEDTENTETTTERNRDEQDRQDRDRNETKRRGGERGDGLRIAQISEIRLQMTEIR